METTVRKKRGLAAIYRLCPARHCLAFLSGALILLHLLTRRNHALMAALSERLVRPVHRALAALNAHVPFSVAELLLALAVLGLLSFLTVQLIRLLRCGERAARLYRLLMTLLAAALSVYAGFCLLWGVFYYGDDFAQRSSLQADPVSVRQLEAVTAWFAGLANEYGERVSRDENGVYTADRRALLDHSSSLYRATVEEFPCLAGPEVAAKGICCSRVMSYVDFTGFFFPFTAEANVNIDFPPSLFAATVAHELAHQRGVAKEQEANFVAVLACLNDGDPDYVYSAALLAYTHLGNALYKADRAAWERVYSALSPEIRADFAANRAYWAQFETPVQTVSNTVYEGFLYSYDQELGLRSYGACVDLLVNYYGTRAAADSLP